MGLAILVFAAYFVACGSDRTSLVSTPTTPTASSSQPTRTSLGFTLQTAFNLYGIQVPVPDGWTMSGVQDLVSLSPPDGTRVQFVLSYMNGPLSAVDVNCGNETPSGAAGPSAVAGHAGSYQFYCPAVAADQSSWMALLASAQGTSAWRWDYLGATGLGSGDYSTEFMTVLQAFSAPSLNSKPTPTPTFVS
jgi:hypothetical protein